MDEGCFVLPNLLKSWVFYKTLTSESTLLQTPSEIFHERKQALWNFSKENCLAFLRKNQVFISFQRSTSNYEFNVIKIFTEALWMLKVFAWNPSSSDAPQKTLRREVNEVQAHRVCERNGRSNFALFCFQEQRESAASF